MADGELSKEELDALQKDIDKAKSELGAQANAEAARKAAEEAQKKAAEDLKAKLAETEKQRQELAEKLEAEKKAAAEKLAALTQRVDQITASRAPVKVEDPFAPPKGQAPQGLNLHDENTMRSIEEQSAELFFGKEEYAQMRKMTNSN